MTIISPTATVSGFATVVAAFASAVSAPVRSHQHEMGRNRQIRVPGPGGNPAKFSDTIGGGPSGPAVSDPR